MKQTIEVEVPDGWELVPACFRTTPDKEIDDLYQLVSANACMDCYFQLRPAWQYPEWLGGAGVACNQHGEWVCYSEPARIANIGMVCTEEYWVGGEEQPLFETWAFPLWTPPPCTDWRKSWHPNPRAK